VHRHDEGIEFLQMRDRWGIFSEITTHWSKTVGMPSVFNRAGWALSSTYRDRWDLCLW